MKMRVHPTLADACIHSLTQSCAHVHTRNHPSLGCCVTNTLRQPALRRQASWAPPELWMRTCSHMQSHRPLQIPWTWVHEPLDKNPQKPQRGHRMAGRSGPVTGCPCQPGRQVTAGNRSRDPRGQGRWTGQVDLDRGFRECLGRWGWVSMPPCGITAFRKPSQQPLGRCGWTGGREHAVCVCVPSKSHRGPCPT